MRLKHFFFLIVKIIQTKQSSYMKEVFTEYKPFRIELKFTIVEMLKYCFPDKFQPVNLANTVIYSHDHKLFGTSDNYCSRRLGIIDI